MFTGLVHGTGNIAELQTRGNYLVMTIAYPAWKNQLILGESIACDGACLTVVSMHEDTFTVELSQETIIKTIAGDYRVGSTINVERAMQLTDRLMGHLVSGHVDTVGRISAKQKIGESLELEVSFTSEFDRLVIPKGSIAINGVSLTINNLSKSAVSVNLIPHTQNMTNLTHLEIGSRVNIEFDLIGKYIARYAELDIDLRSAEQKESSW